jgi:hypothetical protein
MKLQIIRDFIYKLPISKPLQEVLLSILRIGFIAAISAILTYLATVVKLLPEQYQEIAILVLTIIGKEWDKYKFVSNTEKRVKGENNYGAVGF